MLLKEQNLFYHPHHKHKQFIERQVFVTEVLYGHMKLGLRTSEGYEVRSVLSEAQT